MTFTTFAVSSSAATTPKMLHAFALHGADGSSAYSTLTHDAAGNLYGTTVDGGTHNGGIVYELSPTVSGPWKETILYNFKGGSKDGAKPQAAPIFDSAGNLYGTTVNGGVNLKSCNSGCGTVYKLAPPPNGGTWTETILHTFAGGADGTTAYPGLVFDSAGNLYGATSAGGAKSAGILYELSPVSGGAWQETILHTFGGKPDGATPYAVPVFDVAGNLYGTTYEGGAYNQGTVYELSQSSGEWTEKILCSFKGGSDGDQPFAPLVFDQAGNLYGTTAEGGTKNVGTAFELVAAQSWKKIILHQFLGLSFADGAYPNGLAFDAHGNLYGSSVGGGKFNPGTIFRISPTSSGWKEQVLYSFTGRDDGAYPSAAVIINDAGHIFGTTLWGGPAGDTVGGVAFEFIP